MKLKLQTLSAIAIFLTYTPFAVAGLADFGIAEDEFRSGLSQCIQRNEASAPDFGCTEIAHPMHSIEYGLADAILYLERNEITQFCFTMGSTAVLPDAWGTVQHCFDSQSPISSALVGAGCGQTGSLTAEEVVTLQQAFPRGFPQSDDGVKLYGLFYSQWQTLGGLVCMYPNSLRISGVADILRRTLTTARDVRQQVSQMACAR